MRCVIAREVSCGAAQLAVSVWGEDGSPIVALHPGVGDSRIWQSCAPVWADAGHRVVAYDRRGFGNTRYEAESHDDLADLVAVTAATEARPAMIVANSMGGGLALDLALSYPDHVASMVLIAPSPSGYIYDDWPFAAAEAEQDDLVAAAEKSGDVDLLNRLEVCYWLDGVDQPEGRVAGAARDLMIEMNGRALRAEPTGDTAERPGAWPLLGHVSAPVLVVVGEYDLPGIHLQCSELAEALPSGKLRTIEQSAHCPSLDRAEDLNGLVLDFAKSSAGATRMNPWTT